VLEPRPQLAPVEAGALRCPFHAAPAVTSFSA
jgi:hypothetical protein